MCCVVILLILAMPRVALFVLYLDGWLAPAFQTSFWPIMGFLFMPWTTLYYAWVTNSLGGFSNPWHWIGLIVVVAIDMGGSSSSSSSSTRRTS